MAILIVLAIALLAYGFYERLTSGDFKLFKGGGAKPPAAAETGGGFGEIGLALPEGCAIVEMNASERFLYLRIGPAGPCERVLVFDAAAGKVLGSLAGRR